MKRVTITLALMLLCGVAYFFATSTYLFAQNQDSAVSAAEIQTFNSSIADFAWNDLNGNGVQDEGEPGIANVGVKLYDCNHKFLVSTKTDANGSYHFGNLLPGCYIVLFERLPGFDLVTPNAGSDDSDSDADPKTGESPQIHLAAGEHNDTIDAGYFCTVVPQLGSIGDQIWEDLNGNGQQEDSAGEPFVEGVQVQLLEGCYGNTVIDTQTTDSNGWYTFYGLPAGQYRVKVIAPPGFTFTLKNQGPADNDSNANADGTTDCIDLAANDENTTIDAGIVESSPSLLGSIGNQVWRDLNSNGNQDSNEPYVASIQVQLLQGCTGSTILGTQTTDNNGFYAFDNLPAGQYRVKFLLPAGNQFTGKDQGLSDSTDSDANPDGMTDCITLASGEDNSTIDAGLISTPQLGSLGDLVWRDNNGNSVQDSGEPGIAGISVQLRNCNGTTLATTTTDGNGNYNFTNLNAGCYVVRFNNINSSQFSFSLGNQGNNDALDSDVTLLDSVTPGIINGQTEPINLAAGENNPTIDAGLIPVPQNGSLGDRVWRDDNRNGIQDSGEPGVPSVTVQLKDCSNNILRTTTTDGNGIYGFTGLASGCYRVGIVPTGFTISPVNQGSDDTRDSDVDPVSAMTSNINLGTSENNPTIDAGLLSPLACGLTLTKTCTVPPPPPPSSFTCRNAKPINELTLIWNGTQPVSISGEGNTINNIAPGQRVTLNFSGTQNDKIISLGGLGQSTFHLSCSDVDMDGPEDCGKAAGDGKTASGSVNSWIFDGMAGNGQRLACSSTPPPPSDSCTVSLPNAPVCDGKTKPTSLTFKYTGGGCSATNNPQSGKATCTGSINPGLPINIVAGNKDGKNLYTVSPSTVSPGQEFTVSASKFEADSLFKISNGGGTESIKIHTSCSQPLAVGDVFGSLTLVGANGQRSDATVIFDYLVTNTGDALTNVSVDDDKLGDIAGPFGLAPGQSQTFSKSVSLSASTVNTGFVEGNLVDGQLCTASDTVSVTVINGRSQEVADSGSFRVLLPVISR